MHIFPAVEESEGLTINVTSRLWSVVTFDEGTSRSGSWCLN
jgi:hypothetical protein